jgi:uncharacterized protein
MADILRLENIERLTLEYGEGWAYPHARRLLSLVGQIDAGIQYDRLAVEFAIYLHDWGAFPRFTRSGVDHALRSRQIAETEILPLTDLNPDRQAIILEAIERHDYRAPHPASSNEALLLREADSLDFLGITGIAREFAWGPNDLNKCYQRILKRRQGIQGRFTIPAAAKLAEVRLESMGRFLDLLLEESSGFL